MQGLYANLSHVLCGLLLVSRIGDVLSTYLVTPNLALEANPLARKLGWRFALLTLSACLLPYFSREVAVAALMPFLFVSASNTGKVWMVRAMGESAYLALLHELARKSRLSHALVAVAMSAFFVALAGGTILLFYPNPSEDWGFWIGLGVITYSGVVALYGSLWMVRLFRQAAVT